MKPYTAEDLKTAQGILGVEGGAATNTEVRIAQALALMRGEWQAAAVNADARADQLSERLAKMDAELVGTRGVARAAKEALAGAEAQRTGHRERLNTSLASHGYKPGDLQHRWRTEKNLSPAYPGELDDAILDALVNMGGATAWCGDGSSCAAQIVEALLKERDAAKEALAAATTLLSWTQACVVRSARALALAADGRGIDGANLGDTAVGVSAGLLQVDAAITKGEPPASDTSLECNFCDTRGGNGVQIYVCSNCRQKCCAEHSDEKHDGDSVLILCAECAPEPA